MADDPWAEAYNRLRNEVGRAAGAMSPDDIRSCVEDALTRWTTMPEPDTAAFDVLNRALQDAPEIGHEYGYGDLAVDLIATLRAEGYAITREALCSRSGGCRG